eukprot:scpid88459/ scgid34610/ 
MALGNYARKAHCSTHTRRKACLMKEGCGNSSRTKTKQKQTIYTQKQRNIKTITIIHERSCGREARLLLDAAQQYVQDSMCSDGKTACAAMARRDTSRWSATVDAMSPQGECLRHEGHQTGHEHTLSQRPRPPD